LDFENGIAKVNKTFYHDPPLFAASQGNAQRLSDGNYFIGWGQEGYASEYRCCGNTIEDPSKNLVYEIEYPDDNISYRAQKYAWIGKPLYPPSVGIISKECHVDIFVSWNGATQVVKWRVLAGKQKEKLRIIKQVCRSGFETEIRVCDKGPYFRVYAIDHKDVIIGRSEIISVSSNDCD